MIVATLKMIFLPWLVIRELQGWADYDATTIDFLNEENDRLTVALSEMEDGFWILMGENKQLTNARPDT